MGAQPGELPDPLGAMLYATRRETLDGPVKVDRWWYVFKLIAIDPLPPQRLTQARKALSLQLDRRRTQERRAALQRELRRRYRPLTHCNPELLLPECRNGPAKS